MGKVHASSPGCTAALGMDAGADENDTNVGTRDSERMLMHVARFVVVLLAGSPLAGRAPQAQTPAPPAAALTAAAESITAAELARHAGVLAHDSMAARDTPSPGLERTVRYVADQFRTLGLTPGANWGMPDDTAWIQRYPIPGRRVAYGASRLLFVTKLARGGREGIQEDGLPIWREIRLDFVTDARPAVDTARLPIVTWGAALTQRGLLVAGRHTMATLRQAQLRDKFVLYVPAAGSDSATQRQVLDELIATNLAVAAVSDEDSATFVRRAEAARRRPLWLVDPYMHNTVSHGWGAYVRAGALENVLLPTLDIDLAQARATVAPVVRHLPSLLAIHMDTVTDTVTAKPILAPNVVGVLRGTDPSAGAIVVSAHLDNDGRPGGANDNALGVAGLLALAKALSQPGARPRCSVVFVATSGGAKAFWGARYFVQDPGSRWALTRFRLNLTLDLPGRGARDSVHVAGLRDFDLSPRADWLAAQHPELGLTPVDIGTAAAARSDHFAFLEGGVPSLYFGNGRHASPQGADTLAELDTAHAASILTLVFYVAAGAANAERPPHFTAEGRQRRAEVVGGD